MRVGDVIVPYILRREIGEGGIAEVFIAEHPAKGVDVVLKVLRPELAEMLELFLSEPRALQAVEHENTIQVRDVVDDGPHRYFTTELLRGRTLSEVMRAGHGVPALQLSRAMHIARQVATVLAHAHDVDVVHRNLKPANVFLVRNDFVKLLELGATRMQTQGQKPVPGTLIGTPAYMAPEQLRQTAGDYRVDMYSFGVMLFELATGQKPFVGDVSEVVKKHILEPAPRARSIAPNVPEVLDALIAQCLEKDPDARPPSMHEVSLAIAALADGLGPAPVLEEPATSVAVPKNTSGFTTVPVDATSAPPPDMSFDDDEPSFEGVTGERPAFVPARDAAAKTSVAATTSGATLPPAVATTATRLDKPSPHKRNAWPIVAAAAGGAIIMLIAVKALDDDHADTQPVAPDAGSVTVTPPPALPQPPLPPPPPPPAPDAGPAAEEPVEPGKHLVRFTSTPKGAQVWIRLDGRIRYLCDTPCTFTLPAGKRVLIEERINGYESAQRTITVERGAHFDGTLRRR